MKTLAVILHHNTVQHTETLYELLEPEQKSGDYHLMVLDNGSDQGKESKYASMRLDQNVYFGGALDVMSRFLCEEGEEYDSLLWLNNDIIVGKNFVKSLRKECLVNGWNVLSPCIIQPEKTQNHWQQMLNWGTDKTREVRWIDLQTPMISKKLIKYLYDNRTTVENVIDMSLLYGWGIDVYLGVVCESQGWKTGVCDNVPAVHLGSMTLKSLNNTSQYCQNAERGQYEFFQKINKMNEFVEMRKWAESYSI